MKYDAFISYRRETGFLMAQVIRDRLEEKGIRCFLDLEELRSGKFDVKILDAIHDAHSFILILPKNALNRCINEDDWMRIEIMEAVKSGKEIIPVMYDGFKWPKRWNPELPEEIKTLNTYNGVSGSQEYLPAMIDKIISYMPPQMLEDRKKKFRMKTEGLPTGTTAFFEVVLEQFGKDICVDMAFHGGAEWRQHSEKVDLLSYMIENKIHLRILVNSGDAVFELTDSMRQPLKKYVGYDECVRDWKALAATYPECIEVRIAGNPLLHRLYIVRGEHKGAVNVKYYTYGNYNPEKDFKMSFTENMGEYELYVQEFEYLWQHAAEA